ncbi:MAG: PGF-CTERM sorting domain-containing protein [Candidatus Methanospirareceae archaeon]
MIKADDGDGHTDTVTVEIVEEVVTPTSPPTPTEPPEEPGFRAVFAIAGLLAVAYLVLRRRK